MAWTLELNPKTGKWEGSVVLSAYGAVFVEASSMQECSERLYRAQAQMIAEAELNDIEAAYGVKLRP